MIWRGIHDGIKFWIRNNFTNIIFQNGLIID